MKILLLFLPRIYYGKEKYLELYDIEADPLEQHNLIYDSNADRHCYDKIVQELLLELIDFFVETESNVK